MLVNNHFRKQWDWRIKTWFDQPSQKVARRKKREIKAKRIYPRPVAGNLRPLVHCPSNKYNMKVRFGRGFSLEELKKAGISHHTAKTIGISVDYRRRNTNADTLNANAQRLQFYKSKLILFPRKKIPKKKLFTKAGKEKKIVPKKGDATPEELSKAVQQKGPFPFKVHTKTEKARPITEKERTDSAYLTIRKERGRMRKVGDAIRKQRAAEAGTAAAKKAKEGEAGGKKGGKEEEADDE